VISTESFQQILILSPRVVALPGSNSLVVFHVGYAVLNESKQAVLLIRLPVGLTHNLSSGAPHLLHPQTARHTAPCATRGDIAWDRRSAQSVVGRRADLRGRLALPGPLHDAAFRLPGRGSAAASARIAPAPHAIGCRRRPREHLINSVAVLYGACSIGSVPSGMMRAAGSPPRALAQTKRETLVAEAGTETCHKRLWFGERSSDQRAARPLLISHRYHILGDGGDHDG
jgi:hypothetical protein